MFESGTSHSLKADGSIVTEADVEVECQLCAALAKRRPNDGILSEEGIQRVGEQRRWILDPIDGTSYFAAGDPRWGTHIALEESGEIVLGIITRPLQNMRWWAKRGEGAFESVSGHADVALKVSSIDTRSGARVTVWPSRSPLVEALDRLLHGEMEAAIVAGGGPWDYAPYVVLIEEAGGRFHDPAGGRRLDLGGGIYTNGRIDAELEVILADPSTS